MKAAAGFYRYAKALFKIQISEEVDSLLGGCVQLMQTSSLFATFLENPHINLTSKRNVLQTCLQNPLLVNFLALLIERGRLKELPQIAAEYHRMRLEKVGIMEAKLTTAHPIDDGIVAKLKERLESQYGKTFTIQTRVDPRLIGGAILYVGSSFLDRSLKGRLEGLKKHLLRGINGT